MRSRRWSPRRQATWLPATSRWRRARTWPRPGRLSSRRWRSLRRPSAGVSLDSRTVNWALLLADGDLEAQPALVPPGDLDLGQVGGAQHRAVGALGDAGHDLGRAEGEVAAGGDKAAPDGVGGGGGVAGQAAA